MLNLSEPNDHPVTIDEQSRQVLSLFKGRSVVETKAVLKKALEYISSFSFLGQEFNLDNKS